MAYTPRKKITGTMPYRHHADDAPWIDEMLSMFDPGLRAQVSAAYGNAYREAEDLEPVEHRKSGVARRLANTRLRVFVEKKKRGE